MPPSPHSATWKSPARTCPKRRRKAIGIPFKAKAIEALTRFQSFRGAAKPKAELVVEDQSGRLLGGQIVGGDGASRSIDTLATVLITERPRSNQFISISPTPRPFLQSGIQYNPQPEPSRRPPRPCNGVRGGYSRYRQRLSQARAFVRTPHWRRERDDLALGECAEAGRTRKTR